MTAMTRTAKRLYDLEVDEISLVDRPANQHATVAIAKRDEGTMTVINAEGHEVTDLADLTPGEIVRDADTGEYIVACEDGFEPTDYYAQEDLDSLYEEVEDREPELVGKNYRSSLGAQVYEELSKALNDEGRNEVVSKALQEADQRVAAAEAAAERAVTIAKGLASTLEHERLTEVAKGYGVPGQPEVLAEILKGLNPAQAQYLDRVLSSAGEQLFEAYGADLPEQNGSIHGQITALANEAVGKSDVSEAAAVVALYSTNTDAYDAYLAESY